MDLQAVTTSHPKIAFRADLQGLRAVAITLVVLAHAGMPGMAGGFVGVDVFFVLSGYLITGILVREYAASGEIQLAAFIARRLRRLLPALLVMLILVMLIGRLLLSGHEFTEQTASVGYAATWTSNLFFAFTAFDYFAELHFRDLFLHTWSLGVEEQYYLLWPTLSLLLMALAKWHLVNRGGRSFLLLSLGMLFVSSLGLSLYWTSIAPTWAFYLMPSRVWQFALGAGVFVWLEMDRMYLEAIFSKFPAMWVSAARSMGIALIFGSAILVSPDLVYPGLWALLPSFGAAMVIAAGSRNGNGLIDRLLSHPGMVWLGDRSYSWYLWHWPLLMLGFAWGLKGNPTATTALVCLSLGIAMVSYREVELPFWKGQFHRMCPAMSIWISILGIAVVAVGLSQMHLISRDGDERGA